MLRFGMKFGLNWPRGWSGGALVLGKLPVPGRPAIWITNLESSCLFYLSFNFDFCVSKIMHL